MLRRNYLSKFLMGVCGFSLSNILSADELKQDSGVIEGYVPQASGNLDFFGHFTRTYGIKVKFNSYTNYLKFVNDVLSDKIQADFLIVSSYTADALIKAGKVQKVDWSRVKNYEFPKYESVSNTYDKNREYSLPIGTAYLCLAYDKIQFPNTPLTWGVLFDKKLPKSKIGWLNYPNDVFQIAGAYMGYGYNVSDKNTLIKIQKFLIDNASKVNRLAEGAQQDLIAYKEVSHIETYTSAILQVMNEFNHIDIQFPQEGILADESVAVIPNSMNNMNNLYQFVNYLMIPLVGKTLIESTNLDASFDSFLRLTSAKYKNNKFIHPNLNKSAKVYPFLNLGTQYQDTINSLWLDVIKNIPKV